MTYSAMAVVTPSPSMLATRSPGASKKNGVEEDDGDGCENRKREAHVGEQIA
jgi:hypothetical protein